MGKAEMLTPGCPGPENHSHFSSLVLQASPLPSPSLDEQFEEQGSLCFSRPWDICQISVSVLKKRKHELLEAGRIFSSERVHVPVP